LCEIYGIHDIATEFLEAPEITEFHISADERNMILKYRQCPDLQSAVKRVLDVPDATEDTDVLVAKVH
jgi:hypothetical protein